MENSLKKIIAIFVILLITMMIIFPTECINGGERGVFLCIDTVIPSLFPFFVCSGIIIGLELLKPIEKVTACFMKPLFNVSGKGALPFLLGIISGYPIGASCIAELYINGDCSKEECEKMLAFCNNSGPLFILGAVGAKMMQNPKLGRILYGIHFLSAVLTGITFRFGKKPDNNEKMFFLTERKDVFLIITNAFSKACENIISVCGFVVFFSVFGAGLEKMGASPIVHAFFEISAGSENILKSSLPFEVKLAVLSGIIAFSGVSVILQVLKIIGSAKLSSKKYLLGKTVQGIYSGILTYIFLKIIPFSKETSALVTLCSQEDGYETFFIKLTLFIFVFGVYITKKIVDNLKSNKYNYRKI